LHRRGRGALAVTSLAGILINVLLTGFAALFGAWWRPVTERRAWWLTATLLWALANYAEAFSYLIVNSLWLKSDMAGVVAASGISRWIWFFAGTIAAGLIGCGLLPVARKTADVMAGPDGSPRFYRGFFLLYTAAVEFAAVVNRALLG
jgi:hypothetical protein